MSQKLTPKQIVTHPVSAATAVFSTLTLALQVHSLDVLGAFLWANAGELSTVAGIFGFTVLPEIGLDSVTLFGKTIALGWLPGAMKVVAIILFVLYGGKILLNLFNKLQERLTS